MRSISSRCALVVACVLCLVGFHFQMKMLFSVMESSNNNKDEGTDPSFSMPAKQRSALDRALPGVKRKNVTSDGSDLPSLTYSGSNHGGAPQPQLSPPATSGAKKMQTPPSHPHRDPVAVGTKSPTTNSTLHIVFSTDCSAFQHWQSYLFFHSALRVKQPGYITRIASGCTDEELRKEKEWHMKHVQSKMSSRFRIHFTPRFSGVKDEATGEVRGDYKYFNKPFGLRHFLERDVLMGLAVEGPASGSTSNNATKKTMKHPNDVVILTDPDFVLLRPITEDFSGEGGGLVTHGRPHAQAYDLGARWRDLDLKAVTGVDDSPAEAIDKAAAKKYFEVGPPYIATAKDMHDIAVAWSDFVPRAHGQFKPSLALFAEMYAYATAAAHRNLPHVLIASLALRTGGGGWKFLREVPSEKVCDFAAGIHRADGWSVPRAIHYAQDYAVDKYLWSKRKMPKEVFTCEHPLLIEPPMDLGSEKYASVVERGKPESTRKKKSASEAKMEAFMICALTKATNDAMMYFKENDCKGSAPKAKRSYDMWAGKDAHVEQKQQSTAPRSEKKMPHSKQSAKALPVNVTYVDVSGGHAVHPHMGALDENGTSGYIHDETALRRNPPAFEFKDEMERAKLCEKGDPNWRMLQKVFVDLANHEAAERAKRKRAKILCIVYTIDKYHRDRIPDIRETWGQKCDGFIVASTKTNATLGTVNIPHEGKEEYDNIWQKVRSIWSYVYDNYYSPYDYYHIGGDDMYERERLVRVSCPPASSSPRIF